MAVEDGHHHHSVPVHLQGVIGRLELVGRLTVDDREAVGARRLASGDLRADGISACAQATERDRGAERGECGSAKHPAASAAPSHGDTRFHRRVAAASRARRRLGATHG